MSYLTFILIFAAGTALWLVSLGLRDASIVDIFWAPGFALVAWSTALAQPRLSGRACIVLALATLWALRLGLHILSRHAGEDRRYAAMRVKHGAHWWWWSLFQVFALQSALICLISAPLVVAVASAAPLGLLDGIGMAVAIAGLLTEAVADRQLTRFRENPANKGKVMDQGLWSWSRHPNYFGDALMWWGFFFIAFAATHLYWLAFAPLAMTVLLLRISGVSLLEETIVERRPGYADYIRRTSAFVPLPPKRRA